MVTLDDWTAVYIGNAFVFVSEPRGSDDLKLKVDRASLWLEKEAGRRPLMLGELRAVGALHARHDASRASDLLREQTAKAADATKLTE